MSGEASFQKKIPAYFSTPKCKLLFHKIYVGSHLGFHFKRHNNMLPWSDDLKKKTKPMNKDDIEESVRVSYEL